MSKTLTDLETVLGAEYAGRLWKLKFQAFWALQLAGIPTTALHDAVWSESIKPPQVVLTAVRVRHPTWRTVWRQSHAAAQIDLCSFRQRAKPPP